MEKVLRQLAEQRYEKELEALQKADKGDKPLGWKLSPVAVRTFILGSETPVGGVRIAKKFYGDDKLVERAVITLACSRPLILVGDPGTAKTMLSELLAAAICGVSDNTVQGSVGVDEEKIKYSWNYSMLLSGGPTKEALIRAPLYRAMEEGIIVRFEEITRCPAEISDTLISVLSDKVMSVPELNETLFARPGFNVIATANTRDKGVNEMSSALKRRFNFEKVQPICDRRLQEQVIRSEVENQLEGLGVSAFVQPDYLAALSTVFTDIRNGRTEEGYKVEHFDAVMSTAEAVCAYMSCALHGHYYGGGTVDAQVFNDGILAAVRKDGSGDTGKLKNYYESAVKARAEKSGGVWKEIYKHRCKV